MKPLCFDLFCGLGGWSAGFLAEGFDCIGFDIERHAYGFERYPGQLVLQDILTLHGSQLKDAACIVASPPCQAYSYRAMPFKRCKTLPPPDNTLFQSCFRIQREAIEAAGCYIPLVVENVVGAQKWVGRARWHFGSYYLWGDVPALMPVTVRAVKGIEPSGTARTGASDPARVGSTSWFHATRSDPRDGSKVGSGWFYTNTDHPLRTGNSRSSARKAASALIARIPFDLSLHFAKAFKPHH